MIYKIRLSGGTCLGRHLEGATCTVDTRRQAQSGDLVEVLVRNFDTDRIHSYTKQLERTSDGRWWIACLEGVVGLGGYFVPAAIFPIVEVQTLPFPPPPNPICVAGAVDRIEVLKQHDEDSRAARFEWTREGKVRGIPFPGIEAALAVGSPPTDWPESFRLPPNYFPPEASP